MRSHHLAVAPSKPLTHRLFHSSCTYEGWRPLTTPRELVGASIQFNPTVELVCQGVAAGLHEHLLRARGETWECCEGPMASYTHPNWLGWVTGRMQWCYPSQTPLHYLTYQIFMWSEFTVTSWRRPSFLVWLADQWPSVLHEYGGVYVHLFARSQLLFLQLQWGQWIVCSCGSNGMWIFYAPWLLQQLP